MTLILLASLLWCITSALIARDKGRSAVGWALLGLLFGLFAVIAIACLPPRPLNDQISWEEEEVMAEPAFDSPTVDG